MICVGRNTNMSRPRKNIYLTSDQIYEGWKDWKRTGVVPEYWAK